MGTFDKCCEAIIPYHEVVDIKEQIEELHRSFVSPDFIRQFVVMLLFAFYHTIPRRLMRKALEKAKFHLGSIVPFHRLVGRFVLV